MNSLKSFIKEMVKKTIELNLPFHSNIIKTTNENKNFREVLHTSNKSQLTVMSIKPNEDIGEEIHKDVEQYLFFIEGTGKAIIDKEEYAIKPGDVFVVSPGMKHNFINNSNKPLKLFSVYIPPNHPKDTVQKDKKDALKDEKEESE